MDTFSVSCRARKIAKVMLRLCHSYVTINGILMLGQAFGGDASEIIKYNIKYFLTIWFIEGKLQKKVCFG